MSDGVHLHAERGRRCLLSMLEVSRNGVADLRGPTLLHRHRLARQDAASCSRGAMVVSAIAGVSVR